MKQYIGTKLIKAKEMNRLEYNEYRGWEVPADENPLDEGFLVEYMDGGQSNHPNHEGYISWSPKEVFEKAYRRTDGMSFGLAIEALKSGNKVCRTGWNGKGMFLIMVHGTKGEEALMSIGSDYHNAGITKTAIDPHVDMFTAKGTMQPGWLCSQADMLADDWQIVE